MKTMKFFAILLSILLIDGCFSNKDIKKSAENQDDLVDSTVATIGYDDEFSFADTAVYYEVEEKKVGSKPKSVPKGGYDDGNYGSGNGMSYEQDYFEPNDKIAVKSVKKKGSIQIKELVDTIDENSINMGVISYFIPDTMKVGVEYKVNLRISRKLSKALQEGMPVGAIQKEVRVGHTMQAIIKETDPEQKAFKIAELNSAIQSIENDSSYTTWEWSVKPVKSGQHGLKLTIVIKQNNLTKDIPVYDATVYIKASPIWTFNNFINTNWKWFTSTIIIPFIVWWRKKRKKNNETSEQATDTP